MEVSREKVLILNGPRYDYPKVFYLEDVFDFELDAFERLHLLAVALPINWWRYLFHRIFEYMYYKYGVVSPVPMRALDSYLNERDPDVLRDIRHDLRDEIYGVCHTEGQVISWMIYEFVNGTGPGVMTILFKNFDSKEEEPWILESVLEFLDYLKEEGTDWLKPNWGPIPQQERKPEIL